LLLTLGVENLFVIGGTFNFKLRVSCGTRCALVSALTIFTLFSAITNVCLFSTGNTIVLVSASTLIVLKGSAWKNSLPTCKVLANAVNAAKPAGLNVGERSNSVAAVIVDKPEGLNVGVIDIDDVTSMSANVSVIALAVNTVLNAPVIAIGESSNE
jgi:hypothetical protein